MSHFLSLILVLSMIFNSYGSGPAVAPGSSKGDPTESDKTKFLKVGKPLTLLCKLNITEPVQLKWTKDKILIKEDDDHYKIGNRTLTIQSPVIEDDYGYYHCETLKHSPSQHFDISVISLSYKKMRKSMTVLEGEKLKLECDASGMPVPSIIWYKDDEVIDQAFNESHYDLKPNKEGTPNGTLEILQAVMDDRGDYTCFITSQRARFNTTTFVRVKHMYAALWPFLGICAEVIILCLIIFIYEKRRIKNELEESDTDQPTDQKNTSDQNKDVRQRK